MVVWSIGAPPPDPLLPIPATKGTCCREAMSSDNVVKAPGGLGVLQPVKVRRTINWRRCTCMISGSLVFRLSCVDGAWELF